MQDLLPYFQRELQFLHGHRDEFAMRYPELGGRLPTASDLADDPHVERLIQSFALLSSRIHKRLDDDFPLVTESLLEVLYPHYLRPFPACSIAAFDLGHAAAQLQAPLRLPRGTPLDSRPVRGVKCRFRTVFDLALLPVQVHGLSWSAALNAPAATPLPRGATSVLSLTLELLSGQMRWGQLGVPVLRLALNGQAAKVDALRGALLGHAVAVYAQADGQGAWQPVTGLPQAVGFAEDEALLDADARVHPAYRLLTEILAFAPKFHFVDLPLPGPAFAPRGSRITLQIVLAGLNDQGDIARQLSQLQPTDLQPNCSPVVNLFTQRADPIRITHSDTTYPVLPDGARRAYGYEVHAVDRVWRVQQTPGGEVVHEFLPFFSLRHTQLLAEGEGAGRYWYTRRDDALAERSPGYETELAIVDIDFDPALPQTDTLSVQLRATNRDLPSQLSVGHGGGDLFLEGGAPVRQVRLLRVPTATQRFERGQGALWRLVSHLSLNHLSLSQGGIEALRELLRLYDLPRSPTNRRLIDGLVDIDWRADSACLAGNPFPTFVRGLAIRLKVDERTYAGTGLRLLAEGLDHFFGLYVHVNSFTRLSVVSASTGEVLMQFAPRSGEVPLL